MFRRGGHDVGGCAVVAEVERCDEYCQQGESSALLSLLSVFSFRMQEVEFESQALIIKLAGQDKFRMVPIVPSCAIRITTTVHGEAQLLIDSDEAPLQTEAWLCPGIRGHPQRAEARVRNNYTPHHTDQTHAQTSNSSRLCRLSLATHTHTPLDHHCRDLLDHGMGKRSPGEGWRLAGA